MQSILYAGARHATHLRLRGLAGPQGDGSTITVEPGLILGEVNRLLAGHKVKGGHPIQYKLGPDPSSVDSCMIGGGPGPGPRRQGVAVRTWAAFGAPRAAGQSAAEARRL
jgi:FAD/FMN-containing dehydrogenase